MKKWLSILFCSFFLLSNDGNIWVPVSKTIFSASDKHTSMVFKETECTTLIATETGEAPIDTNSIPIILPNSHQILGFIILHSTSESFGIPFTFPSPTSVIIV